MTRPSKEQYIRVHFPDFIKINALFNHVEMNRIVKSLEDAGLLKKRHYDQNYDTTKNLVLKMQSKFKKNFSRVRTNTVNKERI